MTTPVELDFPDCVVLQSSTTKMETNDGNRYGDESTYDQQHGVSPGQGTNSNVNGAQIEGEGLVINSEEYNNASAPAIVAVDTFNEDNSIPVILTIDNTEYHLDELALKGLIRILQQHYNYTDSMIESKGLSQNATLTKHEIIEQYCENTPIIIKTQKYNLNEMNLKGLKRIISETNSQYSENIDSFDINTAKEAIIIISQNSNSNSNSQPPATTTTTTAQSHLAISTTNKPQMVPADSTTATPTPGAPGATPQATPSGKTRASVCKRYKYGIGLSISLLLIGIILLIVLSITTGNNNGNDDGGSGNSDQSNNNDASSNANNTIITTDTTTTMEPSTMSPTAPTIVPTATTNTPTINPTMNPTMEAVPSSIPTMSPIDPLLRCYRSIIGIGINGESEDYIYMTIYGENINSEYTNVTYLGSFENDDYDYYRSNCRLINIGNVITQAKLYNFGSDDLVVERFEIEGRLYSDEYCKVNTSDSYTIGYHGSSEDSCSVLTANFQSQTMTVTTEEPCSIDSCVRCRITIITMMVLIVFDVLFSNLFL